MPTTLPNPQGDKKGLKATFQEEVDKQEADTEFGPPVHELLVKVVKKFANSTKKQANIEDLMAAYKLPANIPFLQSPRIHHSVYAVTEIRGRDVDKEYRVMQSYTSSGMAALVKALDMVMEKEDDIPEIAMVGHIIADALRIFAFSSRDINMRRKDALKGYVDKKYGKLFAHSREIADDDLMGENVDELMKECEEDKRRQEKLAPHKPHKARNDHYWGKDTSNSKPFARGRGSWERRKERRHTTDQNSSQRHHGSYNGANRGRGHHHQNAQPHHSQHQAGFGNPMRQQRGSHHNNRGQHQNRGRN